jgi:hypothetical protein
MLPLLRRPRHILIDDSDCGIPLVQPHKEGSAVYPILIDDSDCGIPLDQPHKEGSAVYPAAAVVELASADPVPSNVSGVAPAVPAIVAAPIANEPAPAAPAPMHVYFKQFAGCQHGNMEPAPPAAPPDAPIMDCRLAVPPQGQCQFLDLECTHMPMDSDDSSGCTGSESSEDGSSFIDDEPAVYTQSDAIYIAKYMTKTMPITAAQLLGESQAAAEIVHTMPKKRRIRNIILSTDSEPEVASDADVSATGMHDLSQ